MAKVTYVEYGETVTKNYQSKRLALGAEVQDGESMEGVVADLQKQVQDFLSGRRLKARKLREMADQVERGEADVEALEIESREYERR